MNSPLSWCFSSLLVGLAVTGCVGGPGDISSSGGGSSTSSTSGVSSTSSTSSSSGVSSSSSGGSTSGSGSSSGSTGGTPSAPPPNKASYATDCAVAGDCVAVSFSNTCCIGCATDAISTKDKARYDTDLLKYRASCTQTACPAIACVQSIVDCAAGKCIVNK